MPIAISYKIENDRAVVKALKKAAKQVSNLRPALAAISADFYRSNIAQFSLGGPGRYEKLKNPEAKKRAVGFIYPLLKRSGKLAASLLKPTAVGAVNSITSNSLILGTKIPYAEYHQFGTDRGLPKGKKARKPVFIDGGPTSSGTGRRDRWIDIIEAHVKERI